MNAKEMLVAAPPHDQAVGEQDDESPDHRADEAGFLVRTIKMNEVAEPGAEQGAPDSKQDGDDATARILARQQQLREAAGEPAEDDDDEPVVMIPEHSAFLRNNNC